jgi:MFS superfamily sulfate permease-like transporter
LVTAFTIAIVASLETLLCIEAADKLDPEKRISDTNRELKAQGIGNMVSGMLGGLPVTSVIVRTSANVYAGAKTRVSSFVHGIFLMATILLIPGLLNKIPLACLAAILLQIGYKLSSPKLFRSMIAQGPNQYIPFIATVKAIVFTDLLTGILIGIVVGWYMSSDPISTRPSNCPVMGMTI